MKKLRDWWNSPATNATLLLVAAVVAAIAVVSFSGFLI
jgi:hypothetical protein